MRMAPWQALVLTWVVSAFTSQLITRASTVGAFVLIVLGGAWLGFAIAVTDDRGTR